MIATKNGVPAYKKFQGRMTQPDYSQSAVKSVRLAAMPKKKSRFEKILDFFRKD